MRYQIRSNQTMFVKKSDVNKSEKFNVFDTHMQKNINKKALNFEKAKRLLNVTFWEEQRQLMELQEKLDTVK